jgi:hypothetical protein
MPVGVLAFCQCREDSVVVSLFKTSNSQDASALKSSLRANGSRECAPDDRLREAIHFAAQERVDCFVALLLAMTSTYDSAFPRRDAPEL